MSWCSNVNKWRAQIQYRNKTFHIGVFKTEIEAYKAYLIKSKEIHGDFRSKKIKDDYIAMFN